MSQSDRASAQPVTYRSLSPKVHAAILLAAWLALALARLPFADGPGFAASTAIPIYLFVRSFFVRAELLADRLTVIGWYSKRDFFFDDLLGSFTAPYAGTWYGGTSGPGILNFNQYAINIIYADRDYKPLHATMGAKKNVEQFREKLSWNIGRHNGWPEDSAPGTFDKG